MVKYVSYKQFERPMNEISQKKTNV